MEPLGNRATLIIALTLVLTMFSAGFVLTKIADSAHPAQCYIHSSTLICTPEA